VDHLRALKLGGTGTDSPDNTQRLSREEGRAKDIVE
jgi:hypothetical protein